MTHKEAITILVNATFSEECQGDKDLTTAYHMAIEALCRDGYNQPRCVSIPMFEYCPICGADIRKETEKMNNYFIAVKVEEDGKLIEKYYAKDRDSGGYPYFNDYIRYHDVRSFKSIEDVKKFLEKEYDEETNSFKYCYKKKFVGKPYVVEMVLNHIEL